MIVKVPSQQKTVMSNEYKEFRKVHLGQRTIKNTALPTTPTPTQNRRAHVYFHRRNALPRVNPLSFASRFNAPAWQPRLKREDITVFTVNCADFFENITNFGNLIVSLSRLQIAMQK
jgi:hypothetical protein